MLAWYCICNIDLLSITVFTMFTMCVNLLESNLLDAKLSGVRTQFMSVGLMVFCRKKNMPQDINICNLNCSKKTAPLWHHMQIIQYNECFTVLSFSWGPLVTEYIERESSQFNGPPASRLLCICMADSDPKHTCKIRVKAATCQFTPFAAGSHGLAKHHTLSPLLCVETGRHPKSGSTSKCCKLKDNDESMRDPLICPACVFWICQCVKWVYLILTRWDLGLGFSGQLLVCPTTTQQYQLNVTPVSKPAPGKPKPRHPGEWQQEYLWNLQ